MPKNEDFGKKDFLGDLIAKMDKAGGEKFVNAIAGAGDYLRYNVTPKQHADFANSDFVRDMLPEELKEDPWARRRAASSYLGTAKWGPGLVNLFTDIRQRFNVGGGDPDNEAFNQISRTAQGHAIEDSRAGQTKLDPINAFRDNSQERLVSVLNALRGQPSGL